MTSFTSQSLALVVIFVYFVDAFTPLPLAALQVNAMRKSPLRRVCNPTMCSSIVSPEPKNKTKTDLENDLYFRMQEWKSFTSNVIRKAAGEETFFERDE
jgi:hypothetical protein